MKWTQSIGLLTGCSRFFSVSTWNTSDPKSPDTSAYYFLLLFCRGSPEALFGHGDVRFLSGTTGKPRPFGASLKWARSARSFLDLEAGEVWRSLWVSLGRNWQHLSVFRIWTPQQYYQLSEDSHPLIILFFLLHHHYCFSYTTVERERSTVCLTHGTFTTSVLIPIMIKAELGRANPDWGNAIHRQCTCSSRAEGILLSSVCSSSNAHTDANASANVSRIPGRWNESGGMLLPRLEPLAAPEERSSYPPLPSNPQGRTSVAALNGKDKTRLLAAVRDPLTNKLCIPKKAVAG